MRGRMAVRSACQRADLTAFSISQDRAVARDQRRSEIARSRQQDTIGGIARRVARPLRAFRVLFRPLISALTAVADRILLLLGVDMNLERRGGCSGIAGLGDSAHAAPARKMSSILPQRKSCNRCRTRPSVRERFR